MSDVTVNQGSPLLIFLSPQGPTPDAQIYVSFEVPNPVSIVLQPYDPTPDAQQFKNVVLDSTVEISLLLDDPIAEIFSSRKAPSISRRLNRSSWQARLGMRTDMVKKKVVDNSILLSAHPTDMIRVHTERDERSGDILSRTIVSNEILPIMFPALKEIPIRRIEREDNQLVLSGVDTSSDDVKMVDAYCPMEAQLRRDDLLIRVLLADNDHSLPSVMIFQVKDEFATFSYNSILYTKFHLSFYDESLPNSVLQAMVDAAAKREIVKW